MNTLVSVNNLSKNFSSFEAVKEISFSINESEILGLLGPNGCGKTTTIGMMLGLLKPTSGEVIINGLNVEKNRINLLKKMNFISCKLKITYRGCVVTLPPPRYWDTHFLDRFPGVGEFP